MCEYTLRSLQEGGSDIRQNWNTHLYRHTPHTHTHTNAITATCYPIIPFDQSGNGKSCGDLSLIQTHGKDIKSSMR